MNRVKVKKENKVLYVPEDRLPYYLNEGYDQIDEDGKVVKRAVGGRTVSLAEYNRVVAELEKTRVALKEAQAIIGNIEKLKDGEPDAADEAVVEADEAEGPEGESKRRRRKNG